MRRGEVGNLGSEEGREEVMLLFIYTPLQIILPVRSASVGSLSAYIAKSLTVFK